MCVCVCVRARVCVCAWVGGCMSISLWRSLTTSHCTLASSVLLISGGLAFSLGWECTGSSSGECGSGWGPNSGRGSHVTSSISHVTREVVHVMSDCRGYARGRMRNCGGWVGDNRCHVTGTRDHWSSDGGHVTLGR